MINYAGSTSRPQLKWEDKETKSAAQGGGADVAAVARKRVCSGCKTPCTIACFASEKVFCAVLVNLIECSLHELWCFQAIECLLCVHVFISRIDCRISPSYLC